MDPVRGWKIVKGEEDLIVFGETLTGFFVAILIQAQESFIDLMGGLSCRRLIHLVDQSLGIGLLGSLSNTLAVLCTQQR